MSKTASRAALWMAVLVVGAVIMGRAPSRWLPPLEAQDVKGWKYLGADGCQGAECHSAPGKVAGRPGQEYKVWKERSPHSKAFEKFDSFEYDAEDWGDALGIDDIHTSERCLRCHAGDIPDGVRKPGAKVAEGVTCESCHGPAEGWIGPHAQPHKRPDMFALGMRDTQNTFVRAETCVRCHLQIEAAIVEAGHPNLSFDLVAFSERLPPHWYERQTWDGLRSWMVGQAVILKTTVDTARRRISKKAPKRRIEKSLNYAATHLTVFRHAAAIFGDEKTKTSVLALDEQINYQDYDAAKVTEACVRASEALELFAKAQSEVADFDRAKIKELYKKICLDKEGLDGIDDFGAEQVGVALFALYNAYRLEKGPRMSKALTSRQELQRLRVDPALRSPRDLYEVVGVDGAGDMFRPIQKMRFKDEVFRTLLEAASTLLD